MINSTQVSQGAVSLAAGFMAYKATQALLNGIYSCVPANKDNKPAFVQESTMRKVINVFSFFAGIAGTIFTADRMGLISAKELISRMTNSTPEKFDQAAFLNEMYSDKK